MKQLLKAATTACCMAMMSMVLAPGANADTWNKKTIITFSGPVEIPGVHREGEGILPAGTYVFKILDSQSNRHIVQIYDQEETKIFATILAIPNYRLKVTDKTVVTFFERPAGQPQALRAWFYPGRDSGEEFVYPKARAMELAKSSNMNVLFTSAELPIEVAQPVQTADETGVGNIKRAQVMAVNPSGEEVQLAQVVTPPAEDVEVAEVAAAPVQAPVQETPVQRQAQAPATVAAAAPVEQTLPATASPLPLLAALGMLALGGAFALRALENRVS